MNLKEKIKSNNFTVGIIGLGYVGLPLAIEFAKKNKVFGFDIDKTRCAIIRENLAAIIVIQNMQPVEMAVAHTLRRGFHDQALLFFARAIT